MPIALVIVNDSPRMKNAKTAVKAGIKFTKVLDFITPIFFTEAVKNKKANTEANTVSSAAAINDFEENDVVINVEYSKIKKSGRKNIKPKMLWYATIVVPV